MRCECGCGSEVREGRRFVQGHNQGSLWTPGRRLGLSKLVQKTAKTAKRNRRIVAAVERGETIAGVARAHGVARQRVQQIIKQHRHIEELRHGTE